MSYSFYLFTQLRTLILSSDVEYDIQFGIDQSLFRLYEKSPYNIVDNSEYECMVNFLNAYKEGIAETCYDVHGTLISKYDWVALISADCITHQSITPRKGDVLQFVRQNDGDPTIGEFLHLPTNQPLNIFADRTLKLNK